MKQAVDGMKFREDLYYRINIVNIEMPPLRERREDIPLIFKHYFEMLCAEYKKKIDFIEPEVLKTISTYYWPGNIRQFRNVIENMIVLNENGRIVFDDLPDEIKTTFGQKTTPQTSRQEHVNQTNLPVLPDLSLQKDHHYELATLAQIEKNAIQNTLKFTNYNKTKTAQILNVSLRTIQRKIKEYNLDNMFTEITE